MGGGLGRSISSIDLYVKKLIVGDTIKLVKKSKSKIEEITRFRSL